MTDFRKPLPSELKALEGQKYYELYQNLLNSRGVRATRFIRKVLGYLGIVNQK
jgi:hypothetical protein